MNGCALNEDTAEQFQVLRCLEEDLKINLQRCQGKRLICDDIVDM